MKSLHISVLVCCLLWHSTWAYYNDQFDQIEQKYESSVESDGQDFFSNPEQRNIETLNQAYSEVEPAQVQSYGNSASNIPQSLLSSSSYENSATSLNSAPELKSLEGKSSEYSKVTHIPTGTMFSMGDKGQGAMEFQSPFSKEPYSIVFRTHSMPVKIKQQHQSLPAPEVEFVRSQEEAHRIKHEVVRPVIQEVHEIIQPYRRVVQEVRPVIENVHTIVSKGEGRGGQGRGAANGPAAGSGAGRGSGLSGGLGGGLSGGLGAGLRSGNGGLNVGYSENLPRYAPPAQQYRNNPNLGQMQSQFSVAQFNALSRGPSPHSRY